MKKLFLFLNLSLIIQCHVTAQYSFNENYKKRYYTEAVQKVSKPLSVFSRTDATINIETSGKLAPVLPTQFGVNTTFRNGPNQRSRAGLYNQIITGMRFPAGSGSNTYFWDGTIPSSFKSYYDQAGTVQTVSGINGLGSNVMTPDIFVGFKQDINGEPIVVVNYFYARYGTTKAGTRTARVKQAADYAAGFVRRMNIELGAKIKYWEIGNECYGKWEVGYNVNDPAIGTVTGKEYGEDFRVFAQTMKAVDPTIKVGAIITEDLDDVWTAGVLPEVKDAADFLSVHEYFTTVKDATSQNLLAAVSQIATIKANTEANVVKYAGKPAGYFPIALTEFNSRGAYNCSMINGLFVTQILGELIKNQIGYACLWVSEWNWNMSDPDCKSFLAVNDPEQNDYTARQAYIPYYYYSKCFGDSLVQSVSDNSNLKVYASSFSSGETGIVLVNTSAISQNVKVAVNRNGKSAGITRCQWYEFYANTIEPTVSGYKKFYINGQTSGTTGGGPEDLNTVAPYEAAVNGTITLTMQPYSVIYLVALPNTSTSLNITNSDAAIRIIPSVVRTGYKLNNSQNEAIKAIHIFDATGKLCILSTAQSISFDRLIPGYYYLKAVYNDKTVVNKFLRL